MRFQTTAVLVWATVGALACGGVAGQPLTLYPAPDHPAEPLDSAALARPVDAERGAVAFTAAQAAADEGRCAEMFRRLGETLWHDPNHPEARRALGYMRVDGAWRRAAPEPRSTKQRRPNETWQARGEHFTLTSSLDPDTAQQVLDRLELLFQAWRQLFADFFMDQTEARALLAGERNPRAWRRPMNVVVHAARADYVAELRSRQPRIAETIGIYFDTARESHFFQPGPGDDPALLLATMHHEGAHQLFQECRPTARSIGRQGNFWITEGVACYFESLRASGEGTLTIGGPAGGRLPAARRRALEDGYYVPLGELAAMGKEALQRRDDLAPLYSQIAGLTAYLIEAEGGVLREPLVRHLSAVYRGEGDPDHLPRLLGRPVGEIDSAYRRWLKSLPQAEAADTVQGY